MSLFLCCDCGGSKTAVAIADASGAVLARAAGGPSNFAYQGLPNFVATVKAAVEAALLSLPSSHPAAAQTLPLPASAPSIFAAAWLGVSGVDSPAVVARLLPPLGALFGLPPTAPRLRIANDTILLSAPLAGAAAANPAIRTCVGAVGGTGSIAASFRLPASEAGAGAPEELARVGGWGWILGDEGGGFHVGREAVRHLLRAYEHAVLRGAPEPDLDLALGLEPSVHPNPDSLRARVLTHFGVASTPELLTLLHDPDPLDGTDADALPAHRLIVREKRLSQLSPFVFHAAFGDASGAGGGDPLALGVLRATADELASQITLLLAPAGTADVPCATDLRVPAATSLLVFGGSLVGIPPYRDLVLSALATRGHVFAGVEYVSDAAEAGARGLVAQFAASNLE
ncbi:hypothetical protein M0805_003496 [Coniferiporia weirii]|nr:hypothetical protein M0805_003496 [Coniferiporia weirii]